MKKNIIKVLLMILSIIFVASSAEAAIKPLEISPDQSFICSLFDLDDLDSNGDGDSYAEVIIYGSENMYKYISSLSKNVEVSCEPR